MSQSITLNLYNENDEIVRTLNRSFIPWGILEFAIDLQEEFAEIEVAEDGSPKNIGREQIERLTDFVVFIFGDAVTPDELKKGASLVDMFSVFRQVFAMVSGIMKSNPTIGQAVNRRANLKKPARK
jgi:hypothetical protein